jgi:hypothetical protein
MAVNERTALELLDLDPDDFHELTPAESEAVEKHSRNVYTWKVLVDGSFDVLVFRSEQVHNNWLYYAGFEYISKGDGEKPDMIRAQGEFYCVYRRDMSERVAEFLDRIMNADPVEA